jgi:hypothetical protein
MYLAALHNTTNTTQKVKVQELYSLLVLGNINGDVFKDLAYRPLKKSI